MLFEENHLLISTEAKISEICKPLKQQFNIKLFNFCRFYFDQKVYILSNNKNALLDFFEKEINFVFPLPEVQANVKRFHHVFTVDNNRTASKNAEDAALRLGIAHGLNLVEIHEDYCDFYSLAVAGEWLNSINNLLVNIELLEEFCVSFNYHIQSIIKDYEREPILLPNSMHVNFNSIKSNTKKENCVKNFLEDIQPQKYSININGFDHCISKTEMLTLRQLAKGCSAKEVARTLELSSHTIDTYVRNMKQRFDCSSKSNLLNLYRQYFTIDKFK